MATETSTDGRKPVRLSLACNQCRKRKVRCDAKLPKCQNCSQRGDDCETSDLRNPGKGPGVRRRANKSNHRQTSATGRSPATDTSVRRSSSAPSPPVPAPCISRISTAVPPSISYDTATSPSAPHKRVNQRDPDEQLSWVSRGYRDMTAALPLREGQSDGQTVSVVTPDALVNTDETTYRFKFMGASSVQCLFNFVNLHLAQFGFPPADLSFNHGMRYVEEFTLPLFPFTELPNLPVPEICRLSIETFFSKIWPLFPAVHRRCIDDDISRFRDMQHSGPRGLERSLSSIDVPPLAAIYAILCIGLDETTGHPSEESTRYLTVSYGLIPHLLALPYISSIQALLLLALALRGRTKDGQASQLIAHAIRMAQSMGLHKHNADQAARQGVDHGLHQRLWWSCHAFEKLTQLESGRPSITQGQEGTYTPPTAMVGSTEPSTDASGEHFTAWVSLSNIMGQISDRIYLHKFTSSAELFAETASLDQILLDWQKSLPDHLRPGSHIGSATEQSAEVGDGNPAASVPTLFLSQQFCHAQLALLRLCLIFPPTEFVAEVKKRKPNLPPSHRLFNGDLVCATAAREIITQHLHLADQGVRSCFLGPDQTLLAVVVLALSILRQPGKRLARADVELLRSATEYVEDHFTRWGQDPGFISLLSDLRERVAGVVHVTARSSVETTGGQVFGRDGQVAVLGDAQPVEDFLAPEVTMNTAGDLEFEEFWNWMEKDFFVG